MSPPQLLFWMPPWWRIGTSGMELTVSGSRPDQASGQVRAGAPKARRRNAGYQQDLLQNVTRPREAGTLHGPKHGGTKKSPIGDSRRTTHPDVVTVNLRAEGGRPPSPDEDVLVWRLTTSEEPQEQAQEESQDYKPTLPDKIMGRDPKEAQHSKIKPSKAIHFRNTPDDVTEAEIIHLGIPFGRVTNVLVLKGRNQAFLEIEE